MHHFNLEFLYSSITYTTYYDSPALFSREQLELKVGSIGVLTLTCFSPDYKSILEKQQIDYQNRKPLLSPI